MSDADWSWLEARRAEVQAMSGEAAAELLNDELSKLDSRLEAEVSDDGARRQVVISAGRDAEAFALVRALVDAAPSLRGWTFIALRPAGGFEFEFHAGGRRIDAQALSFQPRVTEDEAAKLVIRLMVPNPEFEGWADIAWQIIEAGIGEELAARIGGLEVSKREAQDENIYPLESLANYVERHGR